MAEIAEIRQVAGIPVIDLKGKITLGDSSSRLREAIDQLLTQRQTRILLNMAEVSYVDSAGLGAIASCHVKAHAAGGGISLCQVSTRVNELLELTRLNEKLTVFPDEASALNSIGAPEHPAPPSSG